MTTVGRLTLSLAFALAVAAPLAAQDNLEARRQAIARLSLLQGDWVGDAWIQVGRGVRRNLRQREHVEMKLGGIALLVEGTGRELLPDGREGDVLFNAVAVLTFEPDSGYRFRSYLLDGRHGDFEFNATADGFIWYIPTPQGRIRYTATITADEWHEVGEFSPDGTRWFPTMDIRLRRVR